MKPILITLLFVAITNVVASNYKSYISANQPVYFEIEGICSTLYVDVIVDDDSLEFRDNSTISNLSLTINGYVDGTLDDTIANCVKCELYLDGEFNKRNNFKYEVISNDNLYFEYEISANDCTRNKYHKWFIALMVILSILAIICIIPSIICIICRILYDKVPYIKNIISCIGEMIVEYDREVNRTNTNRSNTNRRTNTNNRRPSQSSNTSNTNSANETPLAEAENTV